MRIPEEKMVEVVTEAASDCGLSLVDLEFHGSTVRVTLDRGGELSTADCEAASREIDRRLLEIDPSIRREMLLEVSSPGTGRVLRSSREFDIFRDRPVRVTVAREEGFDTFVATCLGLEGEGVRLAVDGKEVLVPLAFVRKARLYAGDRFAGPRGKKKGRKRKR